MSNYSSAHLRWVFLLGVVSFIAFSPATLSSSPQTSTTPTNAASTQHGKEYLWYEAENMRGFSTGKIGEPLLNPSYLDLPASVVPGWAMSGPGVSAEWTQGGESEWNSAAASADETKATLYQDLEVPRAGQYVFFVRYADWANKTENFVVRVAQGDRVVFQHEFGTHDLIDPHDEVSMYWGWAFTWDKAALTLAKGPARVTLNVEAKSGARRNIDCFVLTNDEAFTPADRQKPDFAAMQYLREWSASHKSLASLIASNDRAVPKLWERPKVGGRDFLMPWNIAKEFWPLLDKPVDQRPLYPFNAEPIEKFVETYKGVRDVPIFKSKLIVPVIYINNLPEYLKEGSPFLKFLRETKTPFAVLINYGSAQMSDTEGHAVLDLLTHDLKDQFLGWISGESVGYVWDQAPLELKISPGMSRPELLEAHHKFYSTTIARKWRDLFHTETGPMWDKLIPAQSTSSTSFAHALSEWGVNLLGVETAAVQPMTAMRIAFTRGAARQFGGAFLYYHAPNFGDTATTFTNTQNFAGPDYFYHSRYGPSMGPSLAWYRKSYYLYYMSGASAIYLEQGFDQFFKPGPGEHPFQLNPLGRITDEFMQFVDKHPDRGTPYTPVAILLDRAHGFEMTDYPQWPFEVSQISRHDRALRELFGVAYYPGLVVEGEPALADRQPFVSGVFGDIFDVLTTAESDGSSTQRLRTDKSLDLLSSYRAVVAGGRIDWSPAWSQRLSTYVKGGGTVVLNAQQTRGLPGGLLGVRYTNSVAEADTAQCSSPGDLADDLSGQMFHYERVELAGASTLISAPNGDPLVTINHLGKGLVIFCAVPDLLGEDERITPVAAHMLAHVFGAAAPIRVHGDVEYLVNRSETGWILTLLNSRGVSKTQQGMAQVDRSAYVDVEINFGSEKVGSATEWVTGTSLKVERGAVNVRVPPGGLSVVELSLR